MWSFRKNYVPGDDCKQELVITDDILAVLDMLDADLGREAAKQVGTVVTETKSDHPTTVIPTRYETLIPTRSIETVRINNTPASVVPAATTVITSSTLPAIVKASDPITSSHLGEAEIDYSDFVRPLDQTVHWSYSCLDHNSASTQS